MTKTHNCTLIQREKAYVMQSESEVAKITFLIFYIVVLGILMPQLAENPMKIG